MIDLRAMKAALKQQSIHFFVDPQWIIPSIIAPFIFTTVTLFLFRHAGGDLLLYAVLGGGVLGMWGNTISSSSWSIGYDRMNGTLEAIMVTPAPLSSVVFGRCLWNSFLGLLNALAVFVVAQFAFGIEVTVQNPLGFAVALVLTLISLSVLGMVFGAFYVVTRASSAVFQMLEYPIYVLSGAVFPLMVLPDWIRPFSYAVPATWGAEALKISSVEGYDSLGLGLSGALALTVLTTVAYLLLSLVLFSYLENKAKVNGSLVRY
ncbi:MAG: ABC transporter permease [Methanomassiliicoccales archaeon]|nr:ABC transporter permease [Methanomassiliicoccales archaeon]